VTGTRHDPRAGELLLRQHAVRRWIVRLGRRAPEGRPDGHARWINRPVAKFAVERNEYDGSGTDEGIRRARELHDLRIRYDYHIILTSRVKHGQPLLDVGNDRRVCGIAKTMTDPMGGLTTTTADALGRTARIDYPAAGSRRSPTPSPRPTPSCSTSARKPRAQRRELWIQHHFDGLGREWKVRRSGPTRTRDRGNDGYDARGNVETTTDERYATSRSRRRRAATTRGDG
jgi:hypothetical protein